LGARAKYNKRKMMLQEASEEGGHGLIKLENDISMISEIEEESIMDFIETESKITFAPAIETKSKLTFTPFNSSPNAVDLIKFENDMSMISEIEEEPMNPIEIAGAVSVNEDKVADNDIPMISKSSGTSAKEIQEENASLIRTKSQVTTPPLDNSKPAARVSFDMGTNNNKATAHTNERPKISKRKVAEELSVRKLQVSVEKSSYVGTTWYILIAVAALLDFLSKVFVDIMDSPDELVTGKKPFISRFGRARLLIPVTEDTFIGSAIRFLDENSVFIGIAFSLMWFVHSFVLIRKKRVQSIGRLDRDSLRVSTGYDFQEKLKMYRSAWRRYAFEVVVQCLLLPLSFYLIVSYLFVGHNAIMDDLLDDDEIFNFNFTTANGKHDEVHSFSAPVGLSAIMVIFQYFGFLFARVTSMALRARIKSIAIKISKRTAKFAIRNPRRFARKLKKFLCVLRWIKYLIPLIATSNKLLGNAMDLRKKRHQHREARAAGKMRKQIWRNRLETLPREKLLPEAALMVQRNFRRRQAKMVAMKLRKALNDAEYRAAQTVQFVFRKRLAEARHKILKKRAEFKMLKENYHNAKNKSGEKGQDNSLSHEEIERMYQLEEELMNQAKEMLNRRMILRPDTRFSVIWKIFFVVCVLFEIATLACSPMLKNYADEKTGEPMRIEDILELHLLPTPVTELEQCGFLPPGLRQSKKAQEGEKKGPLQWIRKFPRWLRQLPRRNQKDEDISLLESKSEGTDVKDKPWYCHKHYATAQGIWISLFKLLLRQFFGFVGIVCFLDVFITFFTGEFHSANGNLIPKPFFTRWILPGIMLQLLVNPQMETVSANVWRLMEYAHHLGLARVVRWIVALFYPLFKFFLYHFIHQIWRPLVKRSNQKKIGE